MNTNKNKENKSSVDFSNYNPYYTDVSEYIKACNKARLMYRENRDIEPFYTAVEILVNTTFPYIKNNKIKHKVDKKEQNKEFFKVLDEIGEFLPEYRIMRKTVRGKNIPNTTKQAFITKESEILIALSRIQREIIKNLSYFKILPRVSIDYEPEADDGLAFN